MSQNSIATVTQTLQSDTNATNNTIVQRDNAGGIYGEVVQGSNLITTGNLTGNVSTQAASFTAGAATHYLCDATSGAITVTLPTASANAGVIYVFVKKDSGSNHVTLSGVSGTSPLTSQYQKVSVFSDGTTWWSV